MNYKIAVSLAAAPLTNLNEVISQLDQAAVDFLHFDIEDGNFVPMMTLGTKIISDLRPLTSRPFDVHLMMVNPDWILDDLVQMGTDRISVHLEACPYPRRTLSNIVSLGVQAGIALNPATPLPDLEILLPYLSFVLILSTEPEYPNASFLPSVLNKVRAGKERYGESGIEWDVDGGINPANLAMVLEAGADVIVVGRSAFQGGNITQNIALLRRSAIS